MDVLTLSATPIPRTLNMSLIGMRDMSVIETPPRDRLAINTQVVQFSEGVIRSAVELELSRSGQIFFIHNRVESIDSVAALIKKIVPEARVAVGHGQMNEKEMEQVMLDFIDYKYDVLVATTIIENGIDIPRANTIIINRADNYGLSQLYQLRGRVGRSNRRAYAYLLIPSELELTPIARRRLSAIREFSDLGAGFRLAALDLELRGAGNILGGQQSGHLDALGFDLYTKMLERTIAEMRGDEIADDVSVSINLGVDVSIPQDLISDAGQRLRTYKRIASAGGDEELAAIRSEVEDRYGRIPRSVENLFEYGRLRKFAERVAIVSIDRTADGIAIKLGDQARVSPEALMRFIEVEPALRSRRAAFCVFLWNRVTLRSPQLIGLSPLSATIESRHFGAVVLFVEFALEKVRHNLASLRADVSPSRRMNISLLRPPEPVAAAPHEFISVAFVAARQMPGFMQQDRSSLNVIVRIGEQVRIKRHDLEREIRRGERILLGRDGVEPII